MGAVAARRAQMIGTITSRMWPPAPTLRTTLIRYWIAGEHAFWVSNLRESQQWIAPWYGTASDYYRSTP